MLHIHNQTYGPRGKSGEYESTESDIIVLKSGKLLLHAREDVVATLIYNVL